MVLGEAGMGKTEFIRAFLEYAVCEIKNPLLRNKKSRELKKEIKRGSLRGQQIRPSGLRQYNSESTSVSSVMSEVNQEEISYQKNWYHGDIVCVRGDIRELHKEYSIWGPVVQSVKEAFFSFFGNRFLCNCVEHMYSPIYCT